MYLYNTCPGGLIVKIQPASVGATRDAGSVPGSGRSPEGGNGNPLQCSCLEDPADRRAWRAAVQGLRRVRNDLAAKQHE